MNDMSMNAMRMDMDAPSAEPVPVSGVQLSLRDQRNENARRAEMQACAAAMRGDMDMAADLMSRANALRGAYPK